MTPVAIGLVALARRVFGEKLLKRSIVAAARSNPAGTVWEHPQGSYLLEIGRPLWPPLDNEDQHAYAKRVYGLESIIEGTAG